MGFAMLLRRQTFSLQDFGIQIRAFLHRLQAIPGTSVALAFPDLLRHASLNCMLRDVCEFVSELVTWLESEAVSMTCGRGDLKVERSEAGSWQYPTLTQLLQPWIYAESMRSAFLSIGTLKCIHIDRALMLTPLLGHNNLTELEETLRVYKNMVAY